MKVGAIKKELLKLTKEELVERLRQSLARVKNLEYGHKEMQAHLRKAELDNNDHVTVTEVLSRKINKLENDAKKSESTLSEIKLLLKIAYRL